ncbi:MAG: hypothetical protein AAB539_03990 [Patescibacteria group bacterium]
MMQIQKELPQFNEAAALLLVTGTQEGVIYRASQGTIEEVARVKEETPHYSDREGFFASRGHGQTFATGAVRELDKGVVRKKFARAFVGKIRETAAGMPVAEVYIFSPRYTLPAIKSELPAEFQKILQGAFAGHYIDKHPFDLLRMIKEGRRP